MFSCVTNMKIIDVEMEVEDLAKFMFIKNVDNVPLEISMGGLENNKDMYYFCLDLFCKGLILLFSNDGKSVAVENLSLDDFEKVKKKMECAGIAVKLEVISTTYNEMRQESLTNLKEIEQQGDNEPLESYKFILNTILYRYTVSFSIFRNI